MHSRKLTAGTWTYLLGKDKSSSIHLQSLGFSRSFSGGVFFYFVISIVFPRRNHSTRQIPENLAAYWIEHDFDWTTSHPNFSSPFLFSIWHLRHCYRAAQNKKKIKQAQSAKSISVPLTPMRRCRGQTCWPSKRPWPIAFLIFVLAEVKLQPNLLQRFSMHFRESAFPAACSKHNLFMRSTPEKPPWNFLDWIREVFLNKSSFWQVLGAGVVTWNVFLSILGHQEYAKAVASTLPQDLKKKVITFPWVSTKKQHSWRYEGFTFWADVPASHVMVFAVSGLPTFQE